MKRTDTLDVMAQSIARATRDSIVFVKDNGTFGVLSDPEVYGDIRRHGRTAEKLPLLMEVIDAAITHCAGPRKDPCGVRVLETIREWLNDNPPQAVTTRYREGPYGLEPLD